jgi:hypothetical protein
VVVTFAMSLLIAPAAQAALGFQGLAAKPSNPAAGAHSDFDIHVGFSDPSDQVKDLTVHLPPGLVGNPTVTPLCKPGELESDACPASSQVGNVIARVNVRLLSGVNLPLTVNGSLYNLEPQSGEPARFGIVLRPGGGLLPKIVQQSAVKLRRGDFGLDTVVNDFPREANGLRTDITSLDLSLMGTVNGKGFIRNPTSCTPKQVTFDAVSYSGHSAHGSAAAFTPANCAGLPFSPKLSVKVGAEGATRAGSNTPLTTIIDQDATEAGLKGAKVLLPSTIGPNSGLLTSSCGLLQFQVNASACPARTIVGKATATSTYVPSALTGPVVIVAPAAGDSVPRLGVELNGPLSIHLLGSFVFDAAGLGNAFAKLPDIPIARFALRFKGGKNGLVSTGENLCKNRPPRFLASFDGFNGAHRQGHVRAQVIGCG